jgi:hypothetical protein
MLIHQYGKKAKDFIKGIINFGAENSAPSILGSMQGSSTDDLSA